MKTPQMTSTRGDAYPPLTEQSPEHVEVARAISDLHRQYDSRRQTKTQAWGECWQAYLGSPQALADLEQNAAMRAIAPKQGSYWRHNIHKSKAYSTVETVLGYLVGATFPNREWATLQPREPGTADVQPILNKYFLHKLDVAGFKQAYTLFLRQLAITGTSCIALPWRREVTPVRRRVPINAPNNDEGGGLVETTRTTYREEVIERVEHGPEFEVISCFDYWLDPDCADPQQSNFMRVIRRTKGQLLDEVARGLWPNLQPGHVCSAPTAPSSSRANQQLVQHYNGISYSPDDVVELLEFWGDLSVPSGYYRDVRAVLVGQHLALFENNPYWGGRPFIVGSFTPVVGVPYGMGILEPILGSLHELDSLTNQRLDNVELTINSMWTYIPDGICRPEDVYVEPGRVIQVADHSSIQQMQIGAPNMGVSYQEQQFLEQDIDQSTGTGAFIGVGQGRGGDRVTAQEIQATRDAGGNRLTTVYTWLEHTVFEPLLNRVWQTIRQFVTEDDTVRIPVNTPQGPQWAWYQVDTTDLNDFNVRAVGATHIADKEFELNKRLQFLELVSANPVMSEQLDWMEVMKDLASRFGYDDFERFMKPQQEEQDQAPPPPGRDLLPEAGVPLYDDHFNAVAQAGLAPQAAAQQAVSTGAVSPEQAPMLEDALSAPSPVL